MRLYSIKNKLRRVWGVDSRSRKRPAGRRYIVGNGTKAEAIKELARVQFEIEAGINARAPFAGSATHIDNFLARYWLYVTSDHRPITIKTDKGRIVPFLNFLESRGIRDIRAIDPNLMSEFRGIYTPGRSRKTWNNTLGLIKAMLNRAVEWGLLEYNPIAGVKRMSVKRVNHYFTTEEIGLILASAGEPLKTAIGILLCSGMRRSELFHLTWRDVDLDNGFIHVRPHDDFMTKDRDERAIPISDKLRERLGAIERKGKYVWRPYKEEDSLTRSMSRLTKTLGIKGSLHTLRHTFGSFAAMSGVPVPVLQAWMGHDDISTTMIYSKLSPSNIKISGDNKPPF